MSTPEDAAVPPPALSAVSQKQGGVSANKGFIDRPVTTKAL